MKQEKQIEDMVTRQIQQLKQKNMKPLIQEQKNRRQRISKFVKDNPELMKYAEQMLKKSLLNKKNV